jgi:bisphosphoglycerate-independent phosphoglycerate mutase (AlkP superfamily)
VLEDVSAGLYHLWPNVRFDAVTVFKALEFYQTNDVRVLYIALDETDTQAHSGRYDLYLDAINRIDAELKKIWETAQAHPSFGGRTTLIITSDHGRGRTGLDWSDHGVGPDGADETWLGVIGPYTPVLGAVDATAGEPTLAEVAATVAAAVELNFGGFSPNAAAPIAGVIVR